MTSLRNLILSRRDRPAGPVEAQEYHVVCDCGEMFAGPRGPTFLRVPCPQCHRQHFVAARSPRTPPLVAAELVASAPLPSSRRSAAGAGAQTAAARAARLGRRLATPARRLVTPARRLAQVPSDARRALIAVRAFFTLRRLLVAAVVLMVLGTGYATWTRRQRARFRSQLQSSLAAGQAALERGDLLAAISPLDVAARAARGLGSDNPLARQAVQLHREAQAWTALCPQPLDEFFSQYSQPLSPSQRLQLVEQFSRQMSGRTLIWDAWLAFESAEVPAADPADAPPNAHAATGRLPVGPQPALDWTWLSPVFRVRLDLAAVRDPLGRSDTTPRRVVFAATLDQLHPDPADPRDWHITLRPDSLTWLTAAGPFRTRGMPDDPLFVRVLADQAAQLGIAEKGGS